MPHAAVQDRLKYAVWITGVPGCGFNTAGATLKGYMMDNIGYRTTHLKHKEWICSLDCLKYRITDPELKNPYFYGFAENYLKIAALPWKKILFLDLDEQHLLDRVTQYREANHIKDGESHEQVAAKLFDLQGVYKAAITNHPLVTFIDANGSPESVVAEIEAAR